MRAGRAKHRDAKTFVAARTRRVARRGARASARLRGHPRLSGGGVRGRCQQEYSHDTNSLFRPTAIRSRPAQTLPAPTRSPNPNGPHGQSTVSEASSSAGSWLPSAASTVPGDSLHNDSLTIASDAMGFSRPGGCAPPASSYRTKDKTVSYSADRSPARPAPPSLRSQRHRGPSRYCCFVVIPRMRCGAESDLHDFRSDQRSIRPVDRRIGGAEAIHVVRGHHQRR